MSYTDSKSLIDFMDSFSPRIALDLTTPATRVTDNVWVGTAKEAASIDFIEKGGFTHVLNCAEHDITTTITHVKERRIVRYCLNARDENDFPLVQLFPAAIAFIDNAVASGGKVFVHCYAGQNRSIAVVLAYIAINTHDNFKTVYTRIHAARPAILNNKSFMFQLARFVVSAKTQPPIYNHRIIADKTIQYDDWV